MFQMENSADEMSSVQLPPVPALPGDHFHISTNALKHMATALPMIPDPDWFNKDNHHSLGNLMTAYQILNEDAQHWDHRQKVLADVEGKKSNLTEHLKRGSLALGDTENDAGVTGSVGLGWLQNLADELSLRLKAFSDPLASDSLVQEMKEKLIARLESDVPPTLEELHGREECVKRSRLAWALLQATAAPLKTVVKRGLLPSCMLNQADLRCAYERESLEPPYSLEDYDSRVSREGLWVEIPDIVLFNEGYGSVDLDQQSLECLSWGFGIHPKPNAVPGTVVRVQLFPKTDSTPTSQLFAIYPPTESYLGQDSSDQPANSEQQEQQQQQQLEDSAKSSLPPLVTAEESCDSSIFDSKIYNRECARSHSPRGKDAQRPDEDVNFRLNRETVPRKGRLSQTMRESLARSSFDSVNSSRRPVKRRLADALSCSVGRASWMSSV